MRAVDRAADRLVEDIGEGDGELTVVCLRCDESAASTHPLKTLDRVDTGRAVP